MPTREYLPRSVTPGVVAAEATVGLIALLVFVVTALLVVNNLTEPFDEIVLQSIRSLATPLGLRFALALALLGQDGIAVGAIFLGIVFLSRRRWAALVVLVAVVGGGEGLDNLFKAVFARPRPSPLPSLIPDQVYSFPSGHAVASVAFFLLLAYFGWQVLGPWQRVVWALACAALALVIAISRVYLGVHYPTDVVGGAALGAFWCESVILGEQLIVRDRTPADSEAGSSRR